MKWGAFLLEKDPLVVLRIAGDVQVNDAIELFLDEKNGSAGCFWEPIKTITNLEPIAHSLKLLSYSTHLSAEPHPVFLDGRLFVLRNSLTHTGTQFTVINLTSLGTCTCYKIQAEEIRVELSRAILGTGKANPLQTWADQRVPGC
jgi:hypothetical protein